MKPTQKLLLALAVSLAFACGDDAKIKLPADGGGSSTIGPITGSYGDAGVRVASCDGAADGTPCGEANEETICIFDACIENSCGDNVRAYGEDCDDGNERDGDGCSARCKKEPKPGCGNGVLEPGEECDDGNTAEMDGCTAECKNPRCGDGAVSLGEECDDGNVGNGDACTSKCKTPPVLCGNGAMDEDEACDDGNTKDGDSCKADCTLPAGSMNDGTGGMSGGTGGTSGGTGGTGGTSGGTGGTSAGTGGTDEEDAGPVDEACQNCRELNCTNYQGYQNPVDGCFDAGPDGEAARGVFGVGMAGGHAPFTPEQVQTCVDAMACARAHHCGHTIGQIASDCYCGALAGSWDLDACNTANAASVAAHAPACQHEWEAVTGFTTPSDVLNAISDSEQTMAGYAYNLLECEATFCDGTSGPGDCVH
jgi:cysteine-rich repeat protein